MKIKRFIVRSILDSGVGRTVRFPHTVIDTTTNGLVDEFSSKRAANMAAKFFNGDPAAAYPNTTATCAWFARCGRPATGTTPHPVLGAVPTCDRCAAFATGK